MHLLVIDTPRSMFWLLFFYALLHSINRLVFKLLQNVSFTPKLILFEWLTGVFFLAVKYLFSIDAMFAFETAFLYRMHIWLIFLFFFSVAPIYSMQLFILFFSYPHCVDKSSEAFLFFICNPFVCCSVIWHLIKAREQLNAYINIENRDGMEQVRRKKQYPALAVQIDDMRIVLENWMQSLPIMWLLGEESEERGRNRDRYEEHFSVKWEIRKTADLEHCINSHS